MRYSKLFGKTVRTPKKDMQTASHKLLYQGGFVRELSAGKYEYLPLGMLVKEKVVKIIDNEMKKLGSQQISIPILQPIEIWERSNRDKAWGDLLMKVEDARGAEFALSATGEGVITEMIAETAPSYKDLPIILHQFLIKIRDEMRPRGGLIRMREFLMKDAYSYHATEEDFMKTYNNFYKAYSNICEALGLEYYPVIANSGALGGDYCHEFQIPCDAGEDHIVTCEKCDYAANVEMAKFKRQEINKDEEVKKYKEVDLPYEVATIPQLVKHYVLPASRFIKNIVYKTPDGKLIIGIVTGNLNVNHVKLAKAVGEDELLEADEKDLDSIGAKSGFVHSWGYEDHKDKITFVADESISLARNLYGGFKTDSTDPINVNYGRDFKADLVADIAEPYNGAECAECGGKLKLTRTIEFGHIFKYDHFYTKHHDGYFVNQKGEKELMYMGAYGIGIDRAIATIVEKYHDENGIIWPELVAPFKVHLIGLNLEDESIKAKSEEVYNKLYESGIEILFDDRRDVSAGQKFADADLIGCPYRVVVSKKTENRVEVKKRLENESKLIEMPELIKEIMIY